MTTAEQGPGAQSRTAGMASCRSALLALALIGTAFAGQAFAQVIQPTGSPLGQQQQQQQQQQNQSGSSNSNSGSATTQQSDAPFEPVTVSAGSTTGSTSAVDRELERQLFLRGGSDALDPDNPRLKPPAAPGEFETWLREVTGQDLKRFGSDLLLPSNRDYAVPATATIPPDYALNVGDTVSIAMTGSIEGSADFEINRNGQINLPRVGPVTLAGVRYRDLRDRVAEAIGRQYRGFEVTASIKELRGVRVYVTGFANNPGAYTVNSLSTLVNAVLAAGGPSAGGSFRSVKLYRNGREVVDFDLYDLIRKGDKSRDPLLQNEDVLFIPAVGQQVAVIGSVNESAIYEVRSGESLGDVLSLAGGPTNLADKDRLVLYRLRNRDSSWSSVIDMTAVGSQMAEAGDIVQILPEGSLVRSLERQSTIVRIEGEVNRPGTYVVAANAPLSQVLDMAGGTTGRAFVYGTRLYRQSVREQQRVSYQQALDQMEQAVLTAPLTQDSSIGADMRQAQIESVRTYLQNLRELEPDGRLVLGIDTPATPLPADLILENNDRIVIPPRIDTVGVFGAVYRPASFHVDGRSPVRVRDYIERAGGTIPAADRANAFVVRANGEILSRKRGALSAPVLPGDTVFVPIKTQSSSLLAKIRDIAAIIFQVGLSAATVAAIQ